MAALPDRSNGAYMLDGLLEGGRKVLVNAGDDAHFGHPRDRFGGWVEVHCDRLDPDALLASLKAGRYYSTRSEEHTSELQSRPYLVCRLLLAKKKVRAHVRK